MVLAALIAFSRLYLFVHFPTDVFAGIVIILDDTKKHAIGNILPIAICDLIFGSVLGGALLITENKDSKNNGNSVSHGYEKNFNLK